MKYLVDPSARTITVIGLQTLDELRALRRLLARVNKKLPESRRYTMDFGEAPTPMAFNAFSPPDASTDGSHVKRRRVGFKLPNGEA